MRFLARIVRLGGKKVSVEELTDAYFCPVGVRSFSEIEMDEVGSYSLRLRRHSRGGKSAVSMNVKQITTYGDHNAWDEHEFTLSDFDEAKAILYAIGFKEFFALRKRRTSFVRGKFHILIEDINDFGPILEVEVMTTKEKAEAAKQDIRDLLEKIGVRGERVVPKSVTNLLMKEKARF
jgi:predicted adenylyl cyclase CyaB